MTNIRRGAVLGLILFLLVFVGLFMFSPVFAQGSVPEGGSPLTAIGWAWDGWGVGCPTYEQACSIGSDDGEDRLESLPLVVGGSSVLSYNVVVYDNSHCVKTYLYNYTDDFFTLIDTLNPVVNDATWHTYTVDISDNAGDVVSIMFAGCSPRRPGAAPVFLSAVTVSDASTAPVLAEGAFQGSFNSDYDFIGLAWSDSDGHNDVGMIEGNSSGTYYGVYTRTVDVESDDWSIWFRRHDLSSGTGHVNVYAISRDTTGFLADSTYHYVDVGSDSTGSNTWQEVAVDLTDFVGVRTSFLIVYSNADVDDFCFAGGCPSLPTPTPTPTNTPLSSSTPAPTNTPSGSGGTATPSGSGGTATPSGSGGTATPSGSGGTDCDFTTPFTCHVVVDNFPTQIAPLTAVPQFTQIPFPTPLYGLNTPAPVYVPTPNFTPASSSSGSVAMGSVDVVADPSDFSSPGAVVLAPGGDSTFPVSVGMSVQNLGVCLPAEVRNAIALDELCYSIALPVIPYLRVGSIDVTAYFALISAVLILVVIGRQIQEH